MTDLQTLTQRVIDFRNKRNWKQYHNPKDMALGMLVEAAEFAELVQYFTGEDLEKRVSERKEAMADELVDVLWWVLQNAHDLDIDLVEAFERKIKKNELKYPVDLTGKSGKGFMIDHHVKTQK